MLLPDANYKELGFYDRFLAVCQSADVDPCGMSVSKALGINKATISTWKSAKTTPKGETVKRIADYFLVSADFLLGRTDDPTDYSTGKRSTVPTILLRKMELLSALDQVRVEAYMDGLLSWKKQ